MNQTPIHELETLTSRRRFLARLGALELARLGALELARLGALEIESSVG